MSHLLESDLLAAGRRAGLALKKSAAEVVRASSIGREHFDVFLSHSIVDDILVLGVVEYLKDANLTAYVDWITDPQLSRSTVNAATADMLRKRMRQCDMMFYLWSSNSQESRWMPWELGYFDAYRGKIAVLPVVQSAAEAHVGTEFVALYPVVDLVLLGSKPIIKVGGLDPKSWLGQSRAGSIGL